MHTIGVMYNQKLESRSLQYLTLSYVHCNKNESQHASDNAKRHDEYVLGNDDTRKIVEVQSQVN